MQKRESTQLQVESLEGRVMMAFDTYMKIEGVPGEATVKGKGGYIDIDSFSWGATNLQPPPGGSPSSSISNLVFTKSFDKASPVLAQAVAKGKVFQKVELTLRKAGGDQQEYLKFTMSDCFVSGFQTSGQGTSDQPTESISFNFAKVTFKYDLKAAKKSARSFADGPIKLVNPPMDTRAVDLNGDGHLDPIFFAYADLRDLNRDLIVDLHVPNDADGNGQMDVPLLVDLDGDGVGDPVKPPADIDGDGTPDMVLPVDVNGFGPPDQFLAVDQNNDGYVDDLILIDLNGDGTADMLGGIQFDRSNHL